MYKEDTIRFSTVIPIGRRVDLRGILALFGRAFYGNAVSAVGTLHGRANSCR